MAKMIDSQGSSYRSLVNRQSNQEAETVVVGSPLL